MVLTPEEETGTEIKDKRNRFYRVIAIVSFFVFVIICGCNTIKNNNSTNMITSAKNVLIVPEPYKMALQETQEQDYDKALRYLDLVIKDFPNNDEYIYRTYFLKSVINSEYINCDFKITGALLDGLKDNVFIKLDERKRILNDTQALLDEVKTFKTPFLESTTYILSNYDKFKKTDFSIVNSHDIKETSATRAVDWFKDYKTPVPSNDELLVAKSDARKILIGSCLDNVIQEQKINYPTYFYMTSIIAYEWDKELSKKLLQKVIEITEDDKYNKYRLDAEDALKNKFSGN
ncbi:MAG: hypothetical protein CVU90_15670 [Firmicutes bacterium HGW-Firmicutes-15]|nr:MAG: hypothetical protein CVU90_15670 [Firmicutes bacterium HGW-Firmicutes-15]